jgi:anthranilate phosphoribosyltransferase
MIKETISKLIEKRDLTEEEAMGAMEEVMTGSATEAQIAAFLTALRAKGETEEEIYACAKVMREKARRIKVQKNAVDVCGTGGDCSDSFNISTTAAFVVAGAGIPVAKHGNRGVSSKCGSADLLQELGVNIEMEPKDVERCIREVGIGFMFAPKFHGAMKYAIKPRREMGVRTVFNVLGPLTNPAGVEYQLMGVYDARLTEKLAKVLGMLGSKRALVVHGSGGLDELSTVRGRNVVSELKDGKVRTYALKAAEEFGFAGVSVDDIKGGDTRRNAELTLGVLKGSADSKYADIVLLNAGAAIYAAERAESVAEGVGLARKSLESGDALSKLTELVEYARGR